MATLKSTRKRLEEASKLDRIKIYKGEKDRVLIDLNGDGQPEAALIDTNDSGRPDLLAIDVNGDHQFNLYLDDTDDNSFPDVVYMDEKGDGNIHLLGLGEEIRDDVHEELVKVFAALTDKDTELDAVNSALHKLAEIVKKMIAQSKEK